MEMIIFVFVYTYFFGVMAVYLLTCAESLQTMIWQHDVCLYWYTTISLAVLIPLVQVCKARQRNVRWKASMLTDANRPHSSLLLFYLPLPFPFFRNRTQNLNSTHRSWRALDDT